MIDAVGILQVHNELTVDPAHLPRVMRSLRRVCKHVIAYDDGSTDGSRDWLAHEADELIVGEVNDWHGELAHKAAMLDRAARHRPAWIVWLDADEEFSPEAVRSIHALEGSWRQQGVTGVRMIERNLWRDRLHHRLDMDHDRGWFMRLWRWHDKLRYSSTEKGLHRTQFPDGVAARDLRLPAERGCVMHYSWDSPAKIAAKLARYARAGDRKSLPRMTDGPHVKLEWVPDSWRWVASAEEGGPAAWSRPFMGPAHEHAVIEMLAKRGPAPRSMLEIGGGTSTDVWLRRMSAGDRFVVWEPRVEPWSSVVDAAVEQARARGVDAIRISTTLELSEALRGGTGRFGVVLVDHDGSGVPRDGCRDATIRALWDGRFEALTSDAVVLMHDAERHRERAGFKLERQWADADWIACPTSELWIGRP